MTLPFSAQILDDSSRDKFEKIANFIERHYHISWLEKLTGLDQRYWDFTIKNETLTLHLEHYCGISLFPATDTVNYENAISITKEIVASLQEENI